MAQATKILIKKKNESEETTEVKAKDLTKEGQRIKDNIDKVVEVIDKVLDKNAEEFVKKYIQKGGQ